MTGEKLSVEARAVRSLCPSDKLVRRGIDRERLVEAAGAVEQPAEGKAGRNAVGLARVQPAKHRGQALNLRVLVRLFSCRGQMSNGAKISWVDLTQPLDASISFVESP